MQAVSQLLLLSQDLLLVLEPVAKSNVLEPVLVDLLVFASVCFLPVLDLLRRQFFAVPAVDRILRH